MGNQDTRRQFNQTWTLQTQAEQSLNDLWEFSFESWRRELEQEVSGALYQGYDFVDIVVDGGGSADFVRWSEGNEPQYDPFTSPAERYDLRDVTFQDVRELHQSAPIEDGDS